MLFRCTKYRVTNETMTIKNPTNINIMSTVINLYLIDFSTNKPRRDSEV